MAKGILDLLLRINTDSLRYKLIKDDPQKFEKSVKCGVIGILYAALGTGFCIALCLLSWAAVKSGNAIGIVAGLLIVFVAAGGALMSTVRSIINSSYQLRLRRKTTGAVGLILAISLLVIFIIFFILTLTAA